MKFLRKTKGIFLFDLVFINAHGLARGYGALKPIKPGGECTKLALKKMWNQDTED